MFKGFDELYARHKRLLDSLFEIQRAEHPVISSIAASMDDAFLNLRDAYLDHVTNYPIAAYRIDEEVAKNPVFKAFVEVIPTSSGFLILALRAS